MSAWLQRLGVEQIVLPARGPLSAERAVRQKKRWFRRGQAWRAGIEPRIATLKHRFGMQRAFYKGEAGFQRHETTGYYVPKAAESKVRGGVEAWIQLQTQLRQLSALNKERALETARVKK